MFGLLIVYCFKNNLSKNKRCVRMNVCVFCVYICLLLHVRGFEGGRGLGGRVIVCICVLCAFVYLCECVYCVIRIVCCVFLFLFAPPLFFLIVFSAPPFFWRDLFFCFLIAHICTHFLNQYFLCRL